MGLFDGLQNAQVFERGQYLTPGEYTLEIQKTIAKRSQNSGDVFIVEFTILESNNPEKPVGSRASWVQSFKNVTIALSSIKEFLLAALGVDTSDKAKLREVEPRIEDIMNTCVASPGDNPLTGERIKVSVVNVTTKKGGPFSRHDWRVA